MKAFFVSFLLFMQILPTFAQLKQVDQVINNDQGVYLLINNSWLKTEGFQVIGEDSFALIEGEWMPLQEAVEFGDYQVSWKCSRCKRYNMDGLNSCSFCGKPKYE